MPGRDESQRVLVFAPGGRNADLTLQVLARAGIEGTSCATMDDLCHALGEGAGCALLTEEALGEAGRARLARQLAGQPAWSDLPLIVLASHTRGEPAGAFGPLLGLGNLRLLDRPVKTRTLIAAARAALRERRRQYDAKHAIEQRDQFLAMLGHELRNPLGAILLAAEMLGRGEEDGGHAGKYRAIIERQAHHLTRLVDDLLDISRVTSGKVILRRRRLDLNEVLRRCVDGLRGLAQARRLDLELELAAPSLWVEGDVVRLEQVFANLLTNAVKYSPPGSRIWVRAIAGPASAEVSVTDTGIGIEPSMLGRIFDLFEQADSSVERAQGGMGIGLTLVKSLVELHGGTVEAHSEGPGRGSEFAVRLPLSASAGQLAQGAPPEGAPNRFLLRVVVVDDNADIRETARDALEWLGCEVAVADDGPSGLALILASRPDLAFVDIGLPGLDGYAVCRQTRAVLGEAVVLIALTGYGQQRDRQRARSAGFDSLLTKPVTIPVLEAALALAAAPRRDEEGAATAPDEPRPY